MSASLDLRAIQSSPIRSATAESRRPRSSGGGNGEHPKRKGLGLKEMEQVLAPPLLLSSPRILVEASLGATVLSTDTCGTADHDDPP